MGCGNKDLESPFFYVISITGFIIYRNSDIYVRFRVLIRFKMRPDSTLTRQFSNSPTYFRRNQKILKLGSKLQQNEISSYILGKMLV